MSQRKYTDQQVIAAVKKANSFQDVLNDLGLARGSYTNKVLKKKIVALGLHEDLLRFDENYKNNRLKAANLVIYLNKNSSLAQDIVADVEESIDEIHEANDKV